MQPWEKSFNWSRTYSSFVGKYDWKTVESYAIWFGLFDNIIWRELLVSLYLPPNFCGTAFPGQESPLDIAIFLWSGNNLGFKILENPNDYFSRKLPWYSSGAAIQIQLFSSSTLFTFFNLYVLLEKIRSGPYTSFYCFCFVFKTFFSIFFSLETREGANNNGIYIFFPFLLCILNLLYLCVLLGNKSRCK